MSILNLITTQNTIKTTVISLNSEGNEVKWKPDSSDTTHYMSATITKNEIESGSKVTDHIVINNREIKMTVTITQTPLNFARSLVETVANTALQNIVPPVIAGIGVSLLNQEDTTNRLQDAFSYLEKLHEDAQPFTVISKLKKYDNVVIQDLTVAEQQASWLKFDITLEQIKFGKTASIKIKKEQVKKDAETTFTSKVDQGKKKLKIPTVKEAEQASSAARNLKLLFTR